LVELDITPTASKDEEEVLSYEFTYIPRNETAHIKITGIITMKNTDDESKTVSKNIEAVVALTIQKSAEIDTEIITLLEQNKVKEAKEAKKKEISLLEAIVAQDPSGRIESALTKAKKSLQDLEAKGNTKHVMKSIKYQKSLKRADSADFLAL